MTVREILKILRLGTNEESKLNTSVHVFPLPDHRCNMTFCSCHNGAESQAMSQKKSSLLTLLLSGYFVTAQIGGGATKTGLHLSQTDIGENREILKRRWPNRRKVDNLKIRFIAR